MPRVILTAQGHPSASGDVMGAGNSSYVIYADLRGRKRLLRRVRPHAKA